MASLPLTWPHKGWDEKVVLEVVPSHRKPRNMSDRVALRLVRFIFLETIAGIPGAIAGTLRHLASIRRFQLDQGWIKTLLEESYNERMHLLTFLELYRPGRVMRFMVWAAQGVFYNTMFVTYLVSPSFCHRFVGYLEDEAVGTYTKCLEEMDKGRLKGWTEEGFRIPEIAVRYWNMPEGKRTMRDLILYIRADEASHRGVNHTLGNLDQTSDPNPFMDEMSNKSHMQLAATKPAGLEREEVLKKYAR
ncbi:inducible alternative oxidase 2 [Collariella sp. IMI 366227]|nr:inducible alternative oxidase 2 [Collariella sp. IMI 366227]